MRLALSSFRIWNSTAQAPAAKSRAGPCPPERAAEMAPGAYMLDFAVFKPPEEWRVDFERSWSNGPYWRVSRGSLGPPARPVPRTRQGGVLLTLNSHLRRPRPRRDGEGGAWAWADPGIGTRGGGPARDAAGTTCVRSSPKGGPSMGMCRPGQPHMALAGPRAAPGPAGREPNLRDPTTRTAHLSPARAAPAPPLPSLVRTSSRSAPSSWRRSTPSPGCTPTARSCRRRSTRPCPRTTKST